MQQKWIAKLMDYNFVVKFKRSKENTIANDTQSREKGEPIVNLIMISLPS